MDWKILFFFIFALTSTATYACSASKQGVLMLKGVVPLKIGIGLTRDQNGALIPTLKSNAPDSVHHSVRVKTSRAPASVDELQKIIIESN